MSIISRKSRVELYFEDGYFDKRFFNGWSYDLRLGEEVFITSQENPIILSKQEPYVTIRPGEFALLITYEKLKLENDVMAFISIKFSYKKQGLINISGFHVDPNYNGKIIFSVFNAGPNDILMKYEDPVFMIFFDKLECPVPDKYKRNSSYNHIPTSMISEIRGQSVSLSNSNQRIEKLEHSLKLYGGIAVSIIVALIILILENGSK